MAYLERAFTRNERGALQEHGAGAKGRSGSGSHTVSLVQSTAAHSESSLGHWKEHGGQQPKTLGSVYGQSPVRTVLRWFCMSSHGTWRHKASHSFTSKCCQGFAHRPNQNAILNLLTLQKMLLFMKLFWGKRYLPGHRIQGSGEKC